MRISMALAIEFVEAQILGHFRRHHRLWLRRQVCVRPYTAAHVSAIFQDVLGTRSAESNPRKPEVTQKMSHFASIAPTVKLGYS